MSKVFCALLVCALVAGIPVTGSIDEADRVAGGPDVTTTTTAETDPISMPAPAVLGLITPTGVPVAVIASNEDWFWVSTPCGNTRVLSEGSPLYETTVVLDPGHGGPFYTGAVASNGLVEKTLNLELAEAVRDVLLGRGIDTVLTRTADYQSSLSVRSALADALHARAMISIHHNGPNQPRSDLPGTEVFFQQDSDESRRLGGLLWEHITKDLSVFDVAWAAAPDSGVMPVISPTGSDAYGMVRQPETTAVLLEVGYMANPAEAKLYVTPVYIRVASLAIADAVEAFLATDDPGAGFSEPRHYLPNRGAYEDRCVDPPLTAAEAAELG